MFVIFFGEYVMVGVQDVLYVLLGFVFGGCVWCIGVVGFGGGGYGVGGSGCYVCIIFEYYLKNY